MNSPHDRGLVLRVSALLQRLLMISALLLSCAASADTGVDATISPSSIALDSTGVVTVHITGVPVGAAIRVERFIDVNGNGVVDAGEFLAEAYKITDGQVPKIGGVRNVNSPGDEDKTADGQITYEFRPIYGSELGRIVASQIIRITSLTTPTPDFSPFTRAFNMTMPSYGQTIRGAVTSNSAAVAHSAVIVLAQQGQDTQFKGGVLTDASGQYTVSLPAGDYMILPVKNGYVANFGTAASVTVSSGQNQTAIDLQLVPATTTLAGQATNAANGNAVGGVQIIAQANDNSIALTSTDPSGNFALPVTAAVWDVQVADASLMHLGFVRPASETVATADTTSGAASNVNFTLTKGTALIYGTITDPDSQPLAGIEMGASNRNSISGASITTDSGKFSIAVTAGDWSLWFSDSNAVLANYVTPSLPSITLADGAAVANNIALVAVNAHLQGAVKLNGQGLAGVRVGAYNQSTNTYVQTTTGSDGSFSLGMLNGTWTLQIESSSAAEFGIVSPSTNYTLSTDQTISGLTLNVLTSTAQISGTVRDNHDQPVASGNVYASTTIGNVTYAVNANITNGSYSLPVANATWNLNVYVMNFTSPAPVALTVAGSNLTQDFTVTNFPVINSQPNNQNVGPGQTFNFWVGSSSVTSATYQWQATNGNGWSDLANDAIYSGADTQSLSGTASLGMDGQQYRCIITNAAGSTTSDAATLTVTGIAASITLQPSDQSVFAGQPTTFNVSAYGTPTPSLQWQVSTNGGNSWSDLSNDSVYSGVTTMTLQLSGVANSMNGYRYHAVATNGVGSPATSMSALLTVSENLQSWQQSHFSNIDLQNPAISGPNAIPSNDGLTNLLKYAFDMDPFTPGGGKPMPAPTAQNGLLTLAFEAIRSDLSYTVEASTDLVTWSTDGVTLAANGTNRQATYTMSGHQAVFLRIVVTTITQAGQTTMAK